MVEESASRLMAENDEVRVENYHGPGKRKFSSYVPRNSLTCRQLTDLSIVSLFFSPRSNVPGVG